VPLFLHGMAASCSILNGARSRPRFIIILGTMDDLMQIQFSCRHCEAPIQLPFEKLEQSFQVPPGPPNFAHLFVAVCAACKRAETYSLERSGTFLAKEAQMLYTPLVSTWDFVGSAGCAAETCNTHLPVFAPVISATSDTKGEHSPSRTNWEAAICGCWEKLKFGR
jgi:hypothetical protein